MKIRIALVLPALLLVLGPTTHAEPAAKAPYAIVHTYPGGDAFWDLASYDAAAHRVYVARENGVTMIDVDTGKVTDRFIEGQQVHSVVLLDGGRALVTNGAADNATIFDRTSGKILAHIPTGKKPDGASLDPATHTLVIMDGIGHDAVFANPDSAAVLGHLALDGEPGTPVPDGHGLAFAAIADHSEISVIDVAARKLVKNYPLPECLDASGLALDPQTHVLLVTCANLKALTVDSLSGRVLGAVKISKYPDAIDFDPTRRVFYVPCIVPGTLDVIAEDKTGAPIVVSSTPLEFGVHTEALDEKNGILYVPAGQIIIPKKGERPGVAPGTFRVLAVDVNK